MSARHAMSKEPLIRCARTSARASRRSSGIGSLSSIGRRPGLSVCNPIFQDGRPSLFGQPIHHRDPYFSILRPTHRSPKRRSPQPHPHRATTHHAGRTCSGIDPRPYERAEKRNPRRSLVCARLARTASGTESSLSDPQRGDVLEVQIVGHTTSGLPTVRDVDLMATFAMFRSLVDCTQSRGRARHGSPGCPRLPSVPTPDLELRPPRSGHQECTLLPNGPPRRARCDEVRAYRCPVLGLHTPGLPGTSCMAAKQVPFR